jgi:hypothetical protein
MPLHRARRRALAVLLAAAATATGAPAAGAADPATAIDRRINFQPPGAATPTGHLADTGLGYLDSRGYGWVDDVTAAPESRSGTHHERGLAADQRLDTNAMMNRRRVLQGGTWVGVKDPARFEVKVPAGTYDVTVGVGDARYVDESHSVTVEGAPLIERFTATTATPFHAVTRRVQVTDGRVTVDSPNLMATRLTHVRVVSTTSPVTTVPVTATSLPTTTVPAAPAPTTVPPTTAPPPTTVPGAPGDRKVSFQPVGAAVPAGYEADTGLGFEAGRGFGWVDDVTAAPEERTGTHYERNLVADQRLDTNAMMNRRRAKQGDDWVGLEDPARWEVALPAGTYDVTVGVGDARYTGESHVVTAEGEPFVDRFTSSTGTPFTSVTKRIEVADGRLTLDSPNAMATRLTHVDARYVSSHITPYVPPPPPVLGSAGSPWLAFYPRHPGTGGVANYEGLEDWLGRDIGTMVQYGDGRSETYLMQNLGGQLKLLAPYRAAEPFRLAYSLPMTFAPMYDGSAEGAAAIIAQWDMLIDDTGGRRDLYRRVAQQLEDAGFGDAIIRLAWEFDNPSARWYAGVSPAKFKAAWRIVHDIFEQVSPDFAFDYNFVRVNAGGTLVRDAYPGNAYVDVIGVDAYDSGFGGTGTVPEGQQSGWADFERVWRVNQLPKLQAAEAFAVEHGKPMSFPEWALSSGGTTKFGSAGGDNPEFIQKMFEWFQHLDRPDGPGLVYASYFQENSSPDGMHSIGKFPQSKVRFHELFGD